MSLQNPLQNFRFRVEIDGIATAAFSEVTIGATETQVIEYRTGSDPAYVRRLPGLTKFRNVTLKCGVTSSLDLFNWRQQVVRGRKQPQESRRRRARRERHRCHALKREQCQLRIADRADAARGTRRTTG